MTPKLPNPLERERVLAILQYLQAKRPQWAWIRVEPASAVRAARYRGKGYAKKMPMDMWADGVADILGIGVGGKGLVPRLLQPAAFEVKRPGQKQRPSQVAFQARWERAGGLYAVVHDPDEVEAKIKEWGL